MLHPDYQYDPKAVPLLIAPILAGDADMTFGSRFAGLGDPLRRRDAQIPIRRQPDHHDARRTCSSALGSPTCTVACAPTRAAVSSRYRSVATPTDSCSTPSCSSTRLRPGSASWRCRSHPVHGGVLVDLDRRARSATSSRGSSTQRGGWSVRGGGASAPAGVAAIAAAPGCLVSARRGASLRPVRQRSDDAALPRHGGRETCRGGVRVHDVGARRHDDIVQCPRCGMLSSSPTLGPTRSSTRYEEVVDEDYLSEEEARRELFGWVSDQMGPSTSRAGGCSRSAPTSVCSCSRRGARMGGVRHRAFGMGGRAGPRRFGVDLQQGPSRARREPSSVDALVMLDVLEHLIDPCERCAGCAA